MAHTTFYLFLTILLPLAVIATVAATTTTQFSQLIYSNVTRWICSKNKIQNGNRISHFYVEPSIWLLLHFTCLRTFCFFFYLFFGQTDARTDGASFIVHLSSVGHKFSFSLNQSVLPVELTFKAAARCHIYLLYFCAFWPRQMATQLMLLDFVVSGAYMECRMHYWRCVHCSIDGSMNFCLSTFWSKKKKIQTFSSNSTMKTTLPASMGDDQPRTNKLISFYFMNEIHVGGVFRQNVDKNVTRCEKKVRKKKCRK